MEDQQQAEQAQIDRVNVEIAKALVEAQKAFAPALKTSNNPHFRSKYAALDACVEAVIDGLNTNGIFLTQKTKNIDGGVLVETIFLHESGYSYSAGELFVPAEKRNAQGYGSALTYCRRYSLMAACGIAPEDDDGNAATSAQNQSQAIELPWLNPNDQKLWARAVDAFKRDGNLVSVMKHYRISKANQEKIMLHAENEGES